MEHIALRMEGISKSFGEAKVLKSVKFELKKGEVHALVGGNGAGKSTLMKIITGVYQLDEGEIFVNGKKTEIDNPIHAKEQGIAMIFQELSLIQTLTVAENIFLGRELLRHKVRDERRMNEEAHKILCRLGIDIDPKMKVSELSVGMSQMVEIAKAVSKEAKIIVFDEPTAALSASETKRLFEMIAQLKQEGVSMVYISHRMNEILEICDRITIMRDGEYITTQYIKDMTLKKIVSQMMGEDQGKGHKFEWIERSYDENAKDLLTVKHLKINDKLQDISFSVKPGEILGLAGLMGSGRTEILETLFGLRHKKGGRIELDGKEVRIRSSKEAIENGLALIPEDRRKEGLVLMHSIKDNAVLSVLPRLSKKGLFTDEKRERKLVEENIKTFGVKAEHINQPIHLLSGGNQQKIVIAKWINTKPKLMMLDEPTAGVDISAKGEILEIVRDFANQGHGVIFVSSELAEMMAICDQIITIYDGKITGKLCRKEMQLEEELQHAIQKA